MKGYQIGSVTLSKSVVSTGENLIISVAVVDWDYLKKSVSSWNMLKNAYAKWGDLIG